MTQFSWFSNHATKGKKNSIQIVIQIFFWTLLDWKTNRIWWIGLRNFMKKECNYTKQRQNMIPKRFKLWPFLGVITVASYEIHSAPLSTLCGFLGFVYPSFALESSVLWNYYVRFSKHYYTLVVYGIYALSTDKCDKACFPSNFSHLPFSQFSYKKTLWFSEMNWRQFFCHIFSSYYLAGPFKIFWFVIALN